MTIPDPGNRIRSYLDRMQTDAGQPDLYTRRSTHLPEQQVGDFKSNKKSPAAQEYLAQHQPRGSDFYEGVPSEGVIGDPDLLLPSGMRTFLYQQVKAASGRSRLYIKMETEGARADPGTPRYSGGVQSRPREWADYGHTISHSFNLVKKVVAGGQAKNHDLPQLREDVPKPVQKLLTKILSKSKEKDRRIYEIMRQGSGIGNLYQNMSSIDNQNIDVHPEIKELLVELDFAIKTTEFRGEKDLLERFGEEVVLMGSHLKGRLPSDR
jgi:hypothetical protein